LIFQRQRIAWYQEGISRTFSGPQVKVAALTGPHLLLQVVPMEAAQVVLDFAAFCSAQNKFDRVNDSQ
jgi:hypothetical protein